MVTLIDGQMVWSDAEAWRSECEARMLLTQYPPHARDDLLAKILEKRGAGAVEKLRSTMAALEGVT